MMAPQDLESELNKEHFQPFRIVTTTGKTYEITEKDRPLLMVGKRTVIIGLRVPETDPTSIAMKSCPWSISSGWSRSPLLGNRLPSASYVSRRPTVKKRKRRIRPKK